MPDASELGDVAIRAESPTRYLRVWGDFNGDRAEDTALLLMRESGEGYGVFVFFGDGHGNYMPAVKALEDDQGTVEQLGIDAAARGDYVTACGNGYWKCAPGEPESLVLKNVSILFFKFESASSVLIWDGTAHAFRQVWLSD